MQDNLKAHISQRREDFEIYNLKAEESWQEISTEIMKKKRRPNRMFFISGIAASLLLLVTFFGVYVKKERTHLAWVINSEWLEAEDYYQQEIDTKWLLIQSKVKDEQLLADIRMMDKAFMELKEDLQDNVDNEEVIAALMESYRLKLKVLDRMLEKIEEQKENETDTLITL